MTMRFFPADEYLFDDIDDRCMLGSVHNHWVKDFLLNTSPTGKVTLKTVAETPANSREWATLKISLLQLPQFPSQINPAVLNVSMPVNGTYVTVYMYCTHMSCPTKFTVRIYYYSEAPEDPKNKCNMAVYFDADCDGCEHVDGLRPTQPVVSKDLKASDHGYVGTSIENSFRANTRPMHDSMMAAHAASSSDLITASVHTHHLSKSHYSNQKRKSAQDTAELFADNILFCNIMNVAKKWKQNDIQQSKLKPTREFKRFIGWHHGFNPLPPVRVDIWHRSAFPLIKHLGT